MATFVKRCTLAFLAMLTLAAVASSTEVSADTPYPNYYINSENSYLKIPAPYEPDGYINLADNEIGSLKKPGDLFIDDKDFMYIADTENHRIVKMDNKGTVHLVIGDTEAGPGKLSNPSGIFVDEEGIVYVADSGNARIAIFDSGGTYLREISKPESMLLGEGFRYQPMKIVVDARKYLYVVNQGDQKGLLMLDPDGEFRGYFGGNKVQANWTTRMVRLLYSKEQRAGTFVNLPYSFNNVAYSPSGEIYATTTGLTSKQIRKFNAVGGDIYPKTDYNFFDRSFYWSTSSQNFIDAAIDRDGNMTIIDKTYGRMYQYDIYGNMLFAFGSNGIGEGMFGSVTALAIAPSGSLYVLDEGRNIIHRFKPTEFTSLVHEANRLYNDGKYEESFRPWSEVQQINNFFELALQAMGQTELRRDQYASAMDYFKQAYDKEGYSEAFYQYRRQYAKENFDVIATSVVSGIVVLMILLSWKRRKNFSITEQIRKVGWLKPVSVSIDFIRETFRIMLHPFLGFEELRYENKGHWGKALILVALHVIVSVLSYFVVSFTFEPAPIYFVDWTMVVLIPLLLWAVWSVVNYGISTIMDGEGRVRDVFIATAYCFAPIIFFTLPLQLATHFLTLQEARFVQLFDLAIKAWCVIMLYAKIRETHSYDSGKAVAVGLLTAIGFVLSIILYYVMYGLGTNLIDFVQQVGKEAFYVGS